MPLTFDVPVHPAGLAVGAQSGLVAWQPTAEQAGTTANVLLRVTDTQGSVALQWFQIAVLMDTQQAPVITSVPPGSAYPNVAYQYIVVAQDGDGDPLTYALINNPDGSQPPSGMALTGTTLSWTPQTFSAYTVLATVQVSDGHGGSATQTWSITVAAQAPAHDPAPLILSTPRTSIALGQTYSYEIVATEADNEPLTYTLTTKPTGSR